MANITGLKYERDFVITRLKKTLATYEEEVAKRVAAKEAHRVAMDAWLKKVLEKYTPVTVNESYKGIFLEFDAKAMKGKPELKEEERHDNGRWPASEWQVREIREVLAQIENSVNEYFTISSLRTVADWLKY